MFVLFFYDKFLLIPFVCETWKLNPKPLESRAIKAFTFANGSLINPIGSYLNYYLFTQGKIKTTNKDMMGNHRMKLTE